MIVIYHQKTGMETSYGLHDSEKLAEVVRNLFASGGYEPVAVTYGDDPETAYRLTQNGVVSDSWSREPPDGLLPIEPRVILGREGQHLGRRSTMVGDLFDCAGTWRVCVMVGFSRVTIPPRLVQLPEGM